MIFDQVRTINEIDNEEKKEIFCIKKQNTYDIVYEKEPLGTEVLFNPSFESNSDPVENYEGSQGTYGFSSSQSGGIWSFNNACLSQGWNNTENWECDFDMRCTGMRYITTYVLIALSPTKRGLLGAFEGPVATNPPGMISRDNNSNLTLLHSSIWINPSTPWVHINIKKIGKNCLILTKTNDSSVNGTVCYSIQDLDIYDKFTIGAGNNRGQNESGKMQVKNLVVKQLKFKTPVSLTTSFSSGTYDPYRLVQISGTLESDSDMKNSEIKIMNGDNILQTTTCFQQGNYHTSIELTPLMNLITIQYDGNDVYEKTSIDIPITVNKVQLHIEPIIAIDKKPGDVLSFGFFSGGATTSPTTPNSITAQFNSQETTLTKGSNGKFSFTIPNCEPGQYNLILKYAGDEIFLPMEDTLPISIDYIDNVILSSDDNNYIVQFMGGNTPSYIIPDEISIYYRNDASLIISKEDFLDPQQPSFNYTNGTLTISKEAFQTIFNQLNVHEIWIEYQNLRSNTINI